MTGDSPTSEQLQDAYSLAKERYAGQGVDAGRALEALGRVSLAFRGQVGWSERAGRLYRVHRGSLQTQDMTPKDLQRHARAIRARIRSDGGIPEWVRAALPLIFLGQWAAIGAHAGLEALRRRLQGVDRLTPVRR